MLSHASLLALVPLLASLVAASPIIARQGCTTATFYGAADAQYTTEITDDTTLTPTWNDLSVSHIETSGGSDIICTFFGVDGAVVSLPADGGSVDVGPPQTITSGSCGAAQGEK